MFNLKITFELMDGTSLKGGIKEDAVLCLIEGSNLADRIGERRCVVYEHDKIVCFKTV